MLNRGYCLLMQERKPDPVTWCSNPARSNLGFLAMTRGNVTSCNYARLTPSLICRSRTEATYPSRTHAEEA